MARNSALSSNQIASLREGKDEVQHRMHWIARSNHPEGCKQQHYREEIEKTSLGVHESGLCIKSGLRDSQQ